MRRIITVSAGLLFIMMLSCSNSGQREDGRVVLISTDMGDITVRLYDETPEHRDNFLKLAGEGYYDGLLFHRVIRNFMVQGGDPDSRNAQPGTRLGGGGPGHTLTAEIMDEFFHKKGALAAARQGDQVNPERRSSGSQFYMVHGKVWRAGELDTMELQRDMAMQQNIFRIHFEAAQEEINQFRAENNEQGFNIRIAELREEADSLFRAAPKFRFSESQRTSYTTVGGYPSLDGAYTVFGEVIEIGRASCRERV